MMTEKFILDSRSASDRSLLDDLCSTHPNATSYQTKEWWEAQEQVFHYKTFYVYVKSGDRYCLLPLSGVRGLPTIPRLGCLPLTQFCDPLYNDDEMISQAIRFAIEVANEGNYSALTLKPRFRLPSRLEEILHMKEYYHDYWIDFRNISLDVLWKHLSKSERNEIRKAEKLSVVVKTSPTDEEIRELNKVMLSTTKRHNVPSYPPSLLHFINRRMKRVSRVYIAKFENRIIAGNVSFDFGRVSIYGYSFALREYLRTGCVPLLLWHAISDSYVDSKQSFDLGIVSPKDCTLALFKSRFGTKKDVLPFYFHGANFEQLILDPNSPSSFLSKIYRLMPLRIHSFLGPRVVSRFG